MDRRKLKKWPKKVLSKSLVSGLYLLTALSLTACFGSSTKQADQQVASDTPPEWVLNPPSDSRYIYGVGSAPKTEDLAQSTANAKQRANADIAAQLRVTVSQTNMQSTEVSKGTDQSEKVITNLSSTTKLDVESLALDQSEMYDTGTTKQYVFVLQRLDRSRVISQLKMDINDLDAQLESMSLASKNINGEDLIAQWRAILPALPLLSLRAQSVALLKLYSKSLVSQPKSEAIIAFEKKLSELLVALSIEVSDPTESSATLASQVRSALTSKGLTPEDNAAETAPLRLVLKTSSTTQLQGTRHYVFLTLDAALQSTKDQTMLANWNVTQRGVSSVASQASVIAETKAAEQLANDLFNYMTQGSN